ATHLAAKAQEANDANLFAALARHQERADDKARAAQSYLTAAQQRAEGDPQSSASLYANYLRLATAEGLSPHTIAQHRLVYAEILFRDGRFTQAQSELDQALVESSGDIPLTANGQITKSRIALVSGERSVARALLREAEAHLRSHGHQPALLAQALGLRGSLKRADGAHEDAHAMHSEALALYRELGDLEGEGEALCFLCTDLSVSADNATRTQYLKQAKLLERALVCYRASHNRLGEIKTLTNLGILYVHNLDDLPQGLDYLRSACQLAHAIGYHTFEAQLLPDLAEALMLSGHIDAAGAAYTHALRALEETQNMLWLPVALTSAAYYQRLVLGDFDRANALLNRADALLAEDGDPWDVAYVLCERGLLYIACGQPYDDHLARIEAHFAQQPGLGKPPNHHTLMKAHEALQRGEPLFRGNCLQEIPDGLKRAIPGLCFENE
ncbi:MAG: hypothetical protein AAFX99_24160, partial [Myxococcota bacterium]